MKPSVEYLGHIIDEKGLYDIPFKIKATPTPTRRSVEHGTRTLTVLG